jgi:RNA polymerase sigma factor (sigma-70 family)
MKSDNEKLAESCIGLVKHIVEERLKHLPMSLKYSDVLSYGMMGLTKAIISFDPQRGVKFSTYAWHKIQGSISEGLRTVGYRFIISDSGALDIDTEDIDIFSPEAYMPEAILERKELVDALYKAIDELPEIERRIVIANDFHYVSQRELAHRLSLPESDICYTHKKALRHLREKLESYI